VYQGFLGEYRHALDAKGRLILPAKFRARLEAGLVITKGLDRCLWCMPQAAWEQWAERLTERVGVGDPRARDFARFIFAGASEGRPDRQGRIFVPEPLRRFAGLERDVAVIGAGPRIEVWSWERWAERQRALEEGMEENLADLGL
jgi:MraZ protein